MGCGNTGPGVGDIEGRDVGEKGAKLDIRRQPHWNSRPDQVASGEIDRDNRDGCSRVVEKTDCNRGGGGGTCVVCKDRDRHNVPIHKRVGRNGGVAKPKGER